MAKKKTKNDKKNYSSATTCYLCEKPFNGDSVRDHCHITGQYRSAAHNHLKLKMGPKVTTTPVVFHNLKGDYSPLLIQAISKVDGKMSCIPYKTEKYISFSLGQLRFIDSIQLLLKSLDRIASANIQESCSITKITI